MGATVSRIFTGGIRWAARILGAALFLLVMLFVIGEGLPNPPRLTPLESLAMAAFALMVAGVLLVWKHEGVGVTLAGFLIFLALNDFRVGWVFLLFALVGVLGLLSWWSRRHAAPAHGRQP